MKLSWKKAHHNLGAFSLIMTQLGRGSVVERADAFAFRTPGATPMLSGIQLREPDGDPLEAIGWGAELFAGSVWSFSAARPGPAGSDLIEAAHRAGLVSAGAAPVMALTSELVEPPRPAGCRVELDFDDSTWDDFWRVSEDAYGGTDYSGDLRSIFRPPYGRPVESRLHPVLVYDADDQPVGAALTVDSEDISGLYWVGVPSSVRRLGIGAWCSAVATERALARGARAVVLQSSPSGVGVYRRLGFSTRYMYDSWVKRLSTPAGVGR